MPLYYYFAFVGAHEERHAEQLRELAREFTRTRVSDEHHESFARSTYEHPGCGESVTAQARCRS
jgi:hypothetical protein